MKGLASLVLRGRVPAAATAMTLGTLALIITPLAVLSGAVIALVTLRHGASEGSIVSGIALVAMAVMGGLLFGQPVALLLVGLGLWAPMLVLALVLRTWRSLSFMVEMAIVAGFGLVVLQYLVLGDPAAFWAEQLHIFLEQIPQPEGGNGNNMTKAVDLIAPWMVGGFAAVWTLQLVISVFVARTWQAQLFNPGGFRKEFHALRLRRWLTYLVPVLLVGGIASASPNIIAQWSLVGMTGFFLQGVALVHGSVAALQAGVGWLVGFYMLVFFALPHSFTVVSVAGFADSWVDMRAKLQRRMTRHHADD